MQELLGRLSALDPDASLKVRVIACFDELIVGGVNSRGLLSAAASLAGTPAGFLQERPFRAMRVAPNGDLLDAPTVVPSADSATVEGTDGIVVWLERSGAEHANDAIILERFALAMRLRHGRGAKEADARRDLAVVLDPEAHRDVRMAAAGRLDFAPTQRYRVIAAPLFAAWARHPSAVEDVVSTPFGPIHALVVPAEAPVPEAAPVGVGLGGSSADLPRSFRNALLALRLTELPDTPVVVADRYGGLLDALADVPTDQDLPDVDLIGAIMEPSWARPTLDALVVAGSLREAARTAGVHHSTMRTRVDVIEERLGFDPLDGLGRIRFGVAYLIWRLRHSRALDLPAPAAAR